MPTIEGGAAMSQRGGGYPHEPRDNQAFTARFDRWYSRLARPYDVAVKLLPVWKRWPSSALPLIRGPRVLEVSFGTGWLLTRYAADFETDGVDLDERMVDIARRNLQRAASRPNCGGQTSKHCPIPTSCSTPWSTRWPSAVIPMVNGRCRSYAGCFAHKGES